MTHLFTLIRGPAGLESSVRPHRRNDAAAGFSSPVAPGSTPRNRTQANPSQVSHGQIRLERGRHVPQVLEQQGIGHRWGILGDGSGRVTLKQNFSQIGANIRFHGGVLKDAVGRITPGPDAIIFPSVSPGISRNPTHGTQARTIRLAEGMPFDERGRLPAPPARRHGHA